MQRRTIALNEVKFNKDGLIKRAGVQNTGTNFPGYLS